MQRPVGTYALLTAGHCGDVGDVWEHTNEPIGVMTANSYGNQYPSGDTPLDGALIDISSSDASNLVYNRFDSVVTIRNQQAPDSDLENDVVCEPRRPGATPSADLPEGSKCGLLLQTAASITYDDFVNLGDQRISDITVRPGDSGGPVWVNPGIAAGVISGYQGDPNGDNNTIYGHIGYLDQQLDATVVKQAVTPSSAGCDSDARSRPWPPPCWSPSPPAARRPRDARPWAASRASESISWTFRSTQLGRGYASTRSARQPG